MLTGEVAVAALAMRRPEGAAQKTKTPEAFHLRCFDFFI
jgi:hypothetical protein